MCTAVCASDVIHRVSMCVQGTKYTYVYLKVLLRVPSRMRLFPSDGSSGSQQRECQQRGFPTDGLRSFQKRRSRQRHSRRGGFPEEEIPAEGFRGSQKR